MDTGLLKGAQQDFNLPDCLQPDLCTLPLWASRFLQTEVIGIQATNTVEARQRDLTAFMGWFQEVNGHLRIEEWLRRDTQDFLSSLERIGRAPSTINRMLGTLSRFARWVHDEPGSPFVGGLPTRGVKELSIEEPPARKLDNREIRQLFKAADNLVLTATRKNARPRRDRAIFATLLFTGLRVSELCGLRFEQYDGKYLRQIGRKGKSRTPEKYLPAQCRAYLDDYLEHERSKDSEQSEFLFLPSSGKGGITRRQAHNLLNKLADEANKHRKDNLIELHPHALRHTFGYMIRHKTNSDSETAAYLGHSSTRYVGRYARDTQSEREEILDSLTVG